VLRQYPELLTGEADRLLLQMANVERQQVVRLHPKRYGFIAFAEPPQHVCRHDAQRQPRRLQQINAAVAAKQDALVVPCVDVLSFSRGRVDREQDGGDELVGWRRLIKSLVDERRKFDERPYDSVLATLPPASPMVTTS
jgi:hypothetical protein